MHSTSLLTQNHKGYYVLYSNDVGSWTCKRPSNILRAMPVSLVNQSVSAFLRQCNCPDQLWFQISAAGSPWLFWSLECCETWEDLSCECVRGSVSRSTKAAANWIPPSVVELSHCRILLVQRYFAMAIRENHPWSLANTNWSSFRPNKAHKVIRDTYFMI